MKTRPLTLPARAHNDTHQQTWPRTATVVALTAAAVALASPTARAQFIPGPEYDNQPALAIIGVHNSDPANPSAYDQGFSGLGIRIGVSDSGINPDHVEFIDAIVSGIATAANPVWSGTSNFSGNLVDYDDEEGEGHGTHVASVAAARLDGVDRPGNIQGVAYNASLVIGGWSVAGLDPDEETIESGSRKMDPFWAQSLEFIVSQNARVINNSWGDMTTGKDPEAESKAFLVNAPRTAAAIRAALAADAVIVFANGNDREKPGEGLNPGAPTALPTYDADIAAYGAWIAVTATSLAPTGALEDRMAPYANYCGVAAAYCIAAPGGDSETPEGELPGAASGVRNAENLYTDNTGYVAMEGTSMAAPVVAGAVALIAEKYPWMTNRNLVSTILTTASHADQTPSLIYGRGLLDVNRAINGPAIFEQPFDAYLPAGMQSTFSNAISGPAGLRKAGDGLLRLTAHNTFAGALEIHAGVLQADTDVSLGAPEAELLIGNATLKLGEDFVTSEDGLWHKPILVAGTDAVIDTNGNQIAYAGGIIAPSDPDASSTRMRIGFVGAPMTPATDLQLEVDWNADMLIGQGVTLSGRGAVLGELVLAGTYAPGNSPATVVSPGSLRLQPTGLLSIDIDGPGTSDGAGNYDRLLFSSPDSEFAANGTLQVLLRGISGSANNDYTPTLGESFEFVVAPGGVTGSFNALQNDGQGLPLGTRLDLVYDPTALRLFVTPAAYAELGAIGAATNTNRIAVGRVLDAVRPAAGLRPSDATQKLLFDALAPQTAASLPLTMDQLGGVSYVEQIGLAQRNAAYLIGEIAQTPTLNRWGSLTNQAHDQAPLVWGRILGRQTDWRGDSTIGTVTDTLGGVALGTERDLGGSRLGLAMAYGASRARLPSGMGSGSAQNLQLMAYGSHNLPSDFFIQGAIGLGGSILSASRALPLVNASYDANIRSANLAARLNIGQQVQRTNWLFQWDLGLNYLGMRTFGFTDTGGPDGLRVKGQATNNTSLQPTLGLAAGIPFHANDTDWQFLASVQYAYELADNRAYLNTTLLGQDARIQSSSIGRNQVTVGLTLSAALSQNTVLSLNVANQFASNFNALSAFANLTVRF